MEEFLKKRQLANTVNTYNATKTRNIELLLHFARDFTVDTLAC